MGDLGIVVQVKGREVPSSDPERERSWLLKNAAEALSQGSGTVRHLERGAVVLTNLRGREVEIDPSEYRWLVVGVLDHPDPPDDVAPPVSRGKHRSVVLLRRDWEFLFDQLKSTHAVAGYLDRVAGKDLTLGDEPVRYYDLAQDDAKTSPGPLPEEWTGIGTSVSAPMLPMAPAAHGDRQAHAMFRTILEDIATTTIRTATEAQRLAVLAELDRLPVGQRDRIGRFMTEALRQVTEDDRGGIVWRMRSVRGGAGQPHLGFVACSRPHTDELQRIFGLWAQLRHHDVLRVTGDVEGLTTGGGRPHAARGRAAAVGHDDGRRVRRREVFHRGARAAARVVARAGCVGRLLIVAASYVIPARVRLAIVHALGPQNPSPTQLAEHVQLEYGHRLGDLPDAMEATGRAEASQVRIRLELAVQSLGSDDAAQLRASGPADRDILAKVALLAVPDAVFASAVDHGLDIYAGYAFDFGMSAEPAWDLRDRIGQLPQRRRLRLRRGRAPRAHGEPGDGGGHARAGVRGSPYGKPPWLGARCCSRRGGTAARAVAASPRPSP